MKGLRTALISMSGLIILSLAISACAQPTATPEPTEVMPTEVPTEVSPTEAPPPTEVPPPTEAPERCLRVGHYEGPTETTNLDTVNVIGVAAHFHSMIFNRLMDRDNFFVLHPELAVSWESNEEANEWTFHLREGVKWHDGKEFTARDVVWTYQRLIDPENESEAAPGLAFLKADGIIAEDDHTVKFILDEPVAELPILITTKNTWIVQDGVTTEDLKFGAVGTGPFMLSEELDPMASQYHFVKWDEYWATGKPKVECVDFFLIPEPTSRNAALIAGEIDISTSVSAATVADLEGDPDITLTSTQAGAPSTFAMWVDTLPFDDVRVRQALKKVIDRQALVDVAFLGFAGIGDDNPIPPDSPFAWRSEVPPRDVEGAMQLLEDAGYGPDNPLVVDLYVTEVEVGTGVAAELIQQQAAEAGIEINLRVYPPGEFWDTIWMQQPFVTSGWIPRHPGEAFPIAYSCDTPYNETHWCRPEWDDLIYQANTTADRDARIELYQEAGRILTEEGGVIIPYFVKKIGAMRANCEGYEQMVFPEVDLTEVSCSW